MQLYKVKEYIYLKPNNTPLNVYEHIFIAENDLQFQRFFDNFQNHRQERFDDIQLDFIYEWQRLVNFNIGLYRKEI